MIKTVTYYWLLVVVMMAVSAGCVRTTSSSGNGSQAVKPLSDSTIVRAERWRLDSLGCLNYRSVDVANAILNELPENYKNCDSMLVLLGAPNGKSQDTGYITYIYYFQIICEQMEGETPDMQWMDFVFRSNDRKFDHLAFGAN